MPSSTISSSSAKRRNASQTTCANACPTTSGRRSPPGMRDWLVHANFATNDEILRDAIESKVPELLRSLRAFKDEYQL
jgi:hypothetical protein